MWILGAHALLNLILGVALARRYGATGVAWAMPISGLVTSAWGYPWMLRRYVFDRRWDPPPYPVIQSQAQ
jgi:O-antigen/teichoic acid export membrane protein